MNGSASYLGIVNIKTDYPAVLVAKEDLTRRCWWAEDLIMDVQIPWIVFTPVQCSLEWEVSLEKCKKCSL